MIQIQHLEDVLLIQLSKLHLILAQKIFDNYLDPTLVRGISNKTSAINLFETSDVEIIDEVTVWDGQDVYDEKDKNNEKENE